MLDLSEITVAILAGGLGTRLSSILPNQQKTIAPINNNTFLHYLLDRLNNAGIKNVVLCTGYLGEQVEKVLGSSYKSINLSFSQEKSQLGTGGALRLVLPFLKSENILVMNGDSFCDVDFKDFLQFHLNNKAYASIVVWNAEDISRFGKVSLKSDNKIVNFEEKRKGNENGWINGGIYLIRRSLISEIADNRKISLEKDVFPRWIGKKLYGYKTNGRFIDIGTPESYSQANEFFKENIKKRFILLDRDGTLITHKPYLSHPDQVELIPGAIDVLKEFQKMGLGILIITNQSGIGRGYFDSETLEKIHQRLTELLAKEGIILDDIYFCPHTPEDDCLCRKPKVELIEKAAKKHNFNPKDCFVIGDNKSDIELGTNIGATTILVKTGHGAAIAKDPSVNPDFVANNLFSAINTIKKLP